MYGKGNKNKAWKTALVHKTAAIAGVSKAYVYLVISGERENENVMATYMTLWEQENQLLKAVEHMYPFFPQPKRGRKPKKQTL
jgi:hypothetical protein